MPALFLKSKRIVEPELLDELPADDPAAIRSRRERWPWEQTDILEHADADRPQIWFWQT